ncbi:intercellular adhesion molecule 1 [Sphaerodactylus townsendi]|uniref:intercellular adhesion molecule 1 n=1 Tax=Sphaerodactylus townsendi TaxID=933632 RepID=UPI002026CCB6|nr:intercellular adhesion molecule 1 [Sphaerodactylus townsendi]
MQPLLSCLLAWLAAATAQETLEQPFVSAWPEKPVVEYGSSVTLNCSTNCQSVLSGGLETNLEKEPAGEGPTWKAFRLVNVNDWESAPSCYFDCSDVEDMKPHRVNFTVYRIPSLVELDPVPVMEVGKSYTLTCRVSDVAPIQNLSVTFLKGGKELHVETYEKNVTREAISFGVQHVITAQRTDHGEEIGCRAALDLRPEGHLFEKASLGQSMKSVVFPSNPQLNTVRHVELNTFAMVTCEVAGVFPAEEAQFELTYAGTRVTFSVNVLGDSAMAHAQLLFLAAGKSSLKCTVSLGPVTKIAEEEVNVYRLPDLFLTMDHQEALVNNSVNVVCEDSHPEDTQPRTFSTQIRNSKGVLASGDGLPLQFTLTAREEDDGQEFTCQVELETGGRPVIRTTSEVLTVYYGPQMNNSTCPSVLTWKVGSMETFSCSALGNPKPKIECNKYGVLYNISVPLHVTTDHQGSYTCNASNPHGFVVTSVTIHVEVSCSTTMLDLMGQEYEESDPSPVATTHHDSQEWMALASAPQRPRYWVYPHRSRDWWQNLVLNCWDDREWLKNFRMTRSTFMSLVNLLRPHLQHQETPMRPWPSGWFLCTPVCRDQMSYKRSGCIEPFGGKPQQETGFERSRELVYEHRSIRAGNDLRFTGPSNYQRTRNMKIKKNNLAGRAVGLLLLPAGLGRGPAEHPLNQAHQAAQDWQRQLRMG